VYHDLSPITGWDFKFDPRPADAPGCVSIKTAVRFTAKEPMVGHAWYYIDPAKGYAIVRTERFDIPPNVPADPKTAAGSDSFRMEDFHQSPHGFWYPGKVVYVNRSGHGRNPTSATVYYHFDFDVPLPDWLFVVDGASKPKE
jgi:hypothetical protein